MTTPQLQSEHLEHLRRSAISDPVIQERGYRSMVSSGELAALGFGKSQQRAPGILLPQWSTDGQEAGCQYRPDHPRPGARGRLIKYENPEGAGIRIDCPPRCQPNLGNPTVPLWITEGIKKGDSIASAGACAIALVGVWGFKGKNNFGAVTMLVDWDYIALKGRRVHIAFDSDIVDKPEVRRAMERLSQHLKQKGADVDHLRLPSEPGHKVGIDDYLVQGHTLAEAATLIEAFEGPLETKTLRRPYLVHGSKLFLQVRSGHGFAFAYLDRDKIRFTQQIDIGNGRVVTPQEVPRGEDDTEIDIVGVPDERLADTRLAGPASLFAAIKEHISRYVDLAGLDLELCCHYVLFTWFYTKVNTLGYLRFISDTGKGKSRAQRVVSDLCFYPLRTSGASSLSGMVRTSQHWMGTLVVDEADLTGDMANQVVKFLNLGFERGQYYVLSDKQDPRKQQYFDPFMPKVLAMRKPFQDNATEGRLLSIGMYETSNLRIPIILPPEYARQAQDMRNLIARFVLEYWTKIDATKMADFSHIPIEARLKQLAMPLSIVFQTWPQGAKRFEDYLIERQRDLKRERAMSWEGALFNTVYAIATGDIDLRNSFSDFYSGDGRAIAVTPSMVASQFKSSAKAVSMGLMSIGFTVETRRVPSGEKKPRTYCIPDTRKWLEIVSRYFFSEIDAALPEAPEVLRGPKYHVFPMASQTSRPSQNPDSKAPEQETGPLGTGGTVPGTRHDSPLKSADDGGLAAVGWETEI